MALSELGTVLLDLLCGTGARFRARGRHGEGEEILPGFLRTLERRGPESPYSPRSKERLRGTTLAFTPRSLSSFVGSLTAALQRSRGMRYRSAIVRCDSPEELTSQ